MGNELVIQLRTAIRERNKGNKSFIYLLEDDKLAKGKSEQSSKAEYKWGSHLYEQGVQVPEMYGLVRPDFLLLRPFYETLIEDWFAVMQKIDGQDIGDTSGTTREEAVRQYRQELEKVLELGICANDSNWGGNAIFGDDEKLYLIDFEDWRTGSESELNRFYERIKNSEIKFR